MKTKRKLFSCDFFVFLVVFAAGLILQNDVLLYMIVAFYLGPEVLDHLPSNKNKDSE